MNKFKDVISRVRGLLKLDPDREEEADREIRKAIHAVNVGLTDWGLVLRSGKIRKPLRDFVKATKLLRKAMNELQATDPGDLVLVQLDRGFRQVNFNVLYALGEVIAPLADTDPGPQSRNEWQKLNAARAALTLMRKLDQPVSSTKRGLYCNVAAELYGIAGDRTDDLHHQCRAVLKEERETEQK